jgi:CHASE2 domain-containing sensor protein
MTSKDSNRDDPRRRHPTLNPDTDANLPDEAPSDVNSEAWAGWLKHREQGGSALEAAAGNSDTSSPTLEALEEMMLRIRRDVTWPPADSPHPEDLNIRIGRYQIRRMVAMGGMGSVYEAVQDQPRRIVALKLLRGGFNSPASLKRLEDEAQHLARLHHPGIAQVFEAGSCQLSGKLIPYMAMEFIPGARWITDFARLRKLTRRQRLELFVQVCDAIEHGHQKGVIHRDIKPANILIDASGRVKVIDFGVASTREGEEASAMEAGASEQRLVGTLQYMSPEQWNPEPGDFSPRSDVYGLGMVLYELLCGRLPYEVDPHDLESAERVIRETPPERPTRFDRSLPGDIERILLTALHKSPAQRYASVADLAEDLRRVLRGEPIRVRANEVGYVIATRVRTLIARHQVTAVLLACLAGLVVAQELGVRAIFFWTPANAYFERSIARLFPARGEGLMERVRLITLREDTDLEALARAGQVQGVSAGDLKSPRRLHGRLLERLADTGVRAVVIDIRLPGESAHDQALLDGILALQQRGIDVAVAADSNVDGPGASGISHLLAPHVRLGEALLDLDEEKIARFLVLYVQQQWNRPAIPSLALAALAAYQHPGCELNLVADAPANLVQLQYWQRHADGQRTVAGDFELISTSRHDSRRTDGGAVGLKHIRQMGLLQLEMPPDTILKSGSVDLDYRHALLAPTTELSEHVNGRVVVIGDTRTIGGDGPYRHPDGRQLHGCYAQAVAIDALLRGQVIGVPRTIPVFGVGFVQMWAIGLAAAGLGAVAAVLAGPNLARRWVYLSAMAVGILLISLISYGQVRYLFNPLVPIVAMLVAGYLVSRAVALARRVFG